MMKEVMTQLFPPDVPSIVKWRLTVFAAFVVIFTHILWACGWLEKAGFGPGFALATEIRDARKDMDNVSLRLLSQDLFEAKSSECEATNRSAKFFFQRRVLALSQEYYNLTKTPALIPPCGNGPS